MDANPRYELDGSDRPWDLAVSGLYGLPFGKGGAFLGGVHGVTDQLISGWQLNWIFTDDAGTPVGYPNHFNYSCGNYNAATGANGSTQNYLNNSGSALSCFSNFGQFDVVSQSDNTSSVRNPRAPQLSLGLQKRFPIREHVSLQFKAEAFNASNTPLYYGPDTNPNDGTPKRNLRQTAANLPGAYTGYGTLSTPGQQNLPRQFQFSGKIFF